MRKGRRVRTHPGEILKCEYIECDGGYSIADVVERTGLTEAEVHGLMQENIRVNDDLAQKLSKGLGTSKAFWIGLQKNHDESRR